MEPFQIFKSLNVGCLITKKGGTVILLAKTEEEMPRNFVEIFEKIQKASQGNLRDYVVKKFKSNQLLLEGAAVDFNCALFFSNFLKHEYRVVIVSKELGDDNLERMRFVHYRTWKRLLKLKAAASPTALSISPRWEGSCLSCLKDWTWVTNGLEIDLVGRMQNVFSKKEV